MAAVNDRVRRLMDDMLETMYLAPGIGLAAPQVGVGERVLVLDVSGEGEKPAPLKIANPEILWRSEELATYSEGCLSLPDHYADVTRPAEIKVRYLDHQNEIRELAAEGLLATCIQHEMDHLDGVLFVDHITALKRNIILRKLAKAEAPGRGPGLRARAARQTRSRRIRFRVGWPCRLRAGPHRDEVSMAFPRLATICILAGLASLPTANGAAAQGAKPDPLSRFQSSLVTPPAPAQITLRQSVYVPAYSSLVGSGGQARRDLAVTLSVRNTSAALPLVIEHIDYYDTAGNLVQHYVPETVAVRPFGTIEILIPPDDIRGGTGAISSSIGVPLSRSPSR